MAFYNAKCFLDVAPLLGTNNTQKIAAGFFVDATSARFLIFSENVALFRVSHWEKFFCFKTFLGIHRKQPSRSSFFSKVIGRHTKKAPLGQVFLQKLYTFMKTFRLWLTSLPNIYNFQVMRTKIRKFTYMT